MRQRVLRPHQSVEEVRELHSGDHPGSVTFGALTSDGEVVATATVRPERCPWQQEREGCWRLRGMATEPAYRGKGLGMSIVNAVLAHVAANGGGLVWCNARTPALAFYRRAGFAGHGEVWVDPHIGPHLHMWLEMPSAQGG